MSVVDDVEVVAGNMEVVRDVIDVVDVPEVSVSFGEDVVVAEQEVVVVVDERGDNEFLVEDHSGVHIPGSSPISRLGLVELETRTQSEIRNSGLDADMDDLPTRSFTWKATPVESSTNGAQRGARFDEEEQGTSFGAVWDGWGNDDGGSWGRSEVLRRERGEDFRSGTYDEIAVESFLRAMKDEGISGEVRQEGPKNPEEAFGCAVRLEERASSRSNGVEFGATSSAEGVVKSWAEVCEEGEERGGGATGDDVTGGFGVSWCSVNTTRDAESAKKVHDADMYQRRRQARERRLQRAGRAVATKRSGYEKK